MPRSRCCLTRCRRNRTSSLTTATPSWGRPYVLTIQEARCPATAHLWGSVLQRHLALPIRKLDPAPSDKEPPTPLAVLDGLRQRRLGDGAIRRPERRFFD